MSMTISCTCAEQSTDQTTLDIIWRSAWVLFTNRRQTWKGCRSWVSGYWYGWPWRVWGGRDPSCWTAVACSLFQALLDLCAQLCPALMSTSASAHSGSEFTHVG